MGTDARTERTMRAGSLQASNHIGGRLTLDRLVSINETPARIYVASLQQTVVRQAVSIDRDSH